jgi:hypothetical protein
MGSVKMWLKEKEGRGEGRGMSKILEIYMTPNSSYQFGSERSTGFF